ncbi:MAG: pyridoxine 4-dehydrogenase [Solirubrobacteraceae bacterium]
MPEDTFLLGSHTVRRIGFGAMRLPGPGVWGPPTDRDAAIAVLRRAVELGVDHIDTAQYYGPDVANELIRSALRDGGSYPEGLLIATKVGGRRGPDAEWLPAATPDELRAGVHDNLRSLGLERLGLVNLRLIGDGDGTASPGVPLAEMLGALIELRDDGLIEAIGVSAVSVEELREARAMTEIACVQNHFSMLDRSGADVLEACRELGIAFVPFFPLGGGDVVGTRRLLEREGLRAVAVRHGATPAQVALAWTLSLGPHVLAIPGTSSVAHLEENLGARDVELDAEDRSMLEA